MINLNDIDKWVPLAAGESFEFASTRPRPVKLEVNCSAETPLFIQLEGADELPRFLALVKGRETVNFVVPGAFSIFHDCPDPSQDVMLWTADGGKVHRENVSAATFTKLHERRAVNPEFEYMRYQMEANMQKRLAAQQAQFERMMNERLGAEGTGTNDSGTSTSAPVTTSSDTQPVGTGSEGGSGG
ncbi:hypothetical protein [Rhizobium phage RHph_X92]|nr:hypothetical protein [Rhizobium phage RHph_X92]